MQPQMQAKFVASLKQHLSIQPDTFKAIITEVNTLKKAGAVGIDMGAAPG